MRILAMTLLKTVIKDAEAGADNGFRCGIFLAAQTPGKSDARRPIAIVADAVLRFIAQTVAESHVRANLPVIFSVNPDIHKGVFRKRVTGKDRELRGLP